MNFVAGKKFKRAILVASIMALLAVALLWKSEDSSALTKLPSGPLNPVVSLGETHGVIVAPDGSLWSWGTSFLGWPVLGLGKQNYKLRPTRIGHDTNWISVSAASEHNLALKSDGTIWAWGENTEDELGDGTKAKMQAVPVPSAMVQTLSSHINSIEFTPTSETRPEPWQLSTGDDGN